MKRKLLFFAAFCLLLASYSTAQRRNGAGGSMQRGPNSASTQRGMGQQSQVRDRIGSQATSQQRQQSRTCTQSTQQLRTRLRTMSRTSGALSKDQASRLREQLRTETQAMNREQQTFMDGLNAEQRSTVQNRTRDMQTSREQFEKMLDALDTELAMEAPDPAKVREQSRQMEATVKKLQTQQQQINYDLGLSD